MARTSSALARPCSESLAPTTRLRPRHSNESKLSRSLMALPRRCRQRRHVGADPLGHRGRHGTAQDRRGLHRNPPLVRQHDRLQPHQILAAAAAGALDVGNAGRDRDRLGQRQPAGRRLRAPRAQPARACRSPAAPCPACPVPRLSRSADGASAGRGLAAAPPHGATLPGHGPARVAVRSSNKSSHGAWREAFAATAGPLGMPSSSATAATVTIAGSMRRKAPLAHFRLAFCALKFMSIP